jgi:hypothetical protein
VDSLDSYLEKLKLIAFFSGFPLIYLIIIILAGTRKGVATFKSKLPSLLSIAYGLVGLLYWGYMVRELYPDYSAENIQSTVQLPLLEIWALLSLLFLIPLFFRNPVLSLLHSLVFMYLLVKDIFSYAFSTETDRHILRNDMKLFTDSLLLNTGTFIVVALIYYFINRARKNKTT